MCKRKACALWTLLVVVAVTQNVYGAIRYDSTDVPKDILDHGTVNSVLNISDGGPIDDLDVVLDISHRWDEDLDVYLMAPDNTLVELFTDVGGNGDGFYGTVLDDEASLSIRDGTAPFVGRYRPEGNLSVLNGKDRRGIWKLIVTDDSILISGTLNSWALIIDSVSVPGGPAPPEPADPDPADGATQVNIETVLSWGPVELAERGFRLLATTGSEGIEPFSLIELQTEPVATVRRGNSCGAYPIDFSPEGELYGGGFFLYKLTPSDINIPCTRIGDFHSATENDILMTGLAFHPDGTLYGTTFDFATLDSIIYTIEKNTAFATEQFRIPIWQEVPWAIDFSSDGTLYGAFDKLFVIDVTTGQTSTICDVNANDIDSAADGFIYATIDDTSMFHKIDPSIGAIVEEYGPYETPLWGIASQDIGESENAVQILGDNFNRRPFEQLLNPGATSTSTSIDNSDLSAAIQARQKLRAKLRTLRKSFASQMMTTQRTNRVMSPSDTHYSEIGQGTVSSNPAQSSGSITYDVFLGTVSPPTTLICSDIHTPKCDPAGLEYCTTYYWQIVAKNARGETTAGPVWSFTTDTVPADLDKDCDVDFDDLFIFMSYWGFGVQ